MIRQKISQFTQSLQNQNIVPLWAIANEHVILSAATNKKHTWKNKSKKVFLLMKIAGFLKISDLLILAVGFYGVLILWFKVRKNYFQTKVDSANYQKIFVGHGANAEEFIFSNFIKMTDVPVLRINVITLENMEKIGVPSLMSLIIFLIKNSFGLSDKIKKLSSIPKINKLDFLATAALNIREYVFFCIFFRNAQLKKINETIFLALHIAAHASVHERMKTIYYSHGLIKLSIVMVKPDYIIVSTPDEQKYLEYVFNDRKCELFKYQKQTIKDKKNSVIVLSPEILACFSEETRKNFYSFLRWAKSSHYEIIFRPSPRISKHDLLSLDKELSNYGKIDSLSESFEERLLLLRPKLVAGFNTTAFFTTLNFGVLPISFCNSDTDERIYNMIYPMKLRALFWPRDELLIQKAIHSEDVYSNNIAMLENSPDNELSQFNEKAFCCSWVIEARGLTTKCENHL